MSARLTIDLDAIADNWRALDATHQGQTAGVIKADAYGLGAAYVAPKLEAAGCRHFFVAHLSEALLVRPRIPRAMLAVLNGLEAGQEDDFIAHGIIPVLGSLHELGLWRARASKLGRVLPAILHVDTGMARLGLAAVEMTRLAADRLLLDGIGIDYVMTHLVSAETPDDPENARQLARFNAARAFFGPGQKYSLANSSGMFLGGPFASDLARPGAAVYGINPTPGRTTPMRPVVRLAARILQVHELRAGETVGYNGAWRAARPSRIATIGVGYADGFLRSLSNSATARFDGGRFDGDRFDGDRFDGDRFDGDIVPLVGRVSMDLTTFDITDTAARIGDVLELIGPGHDADALAIEAGTSGYEILTSLGRRYQRHYVGITAGA